MSKKKSCKHNNINCGSGGMLYSLGFIGAFVYYLTSTTGFWAGVLGFFKALVWPVFIVFELMKFLGM
jgi:hypothetical protein